MQKREIVERRFRDAALGEQTEPTVERRLYNALLFKYIGERPVAHHFSKAVALANGVGHPRSHEGGVRHGGLVSVDPVALAPDERRGREQGSGGLVLRLLYPA